jgi:hypothetical protein
MRINEKSFNSKNLIIKSFLVARIEKKNAFWDIITLVENGGFMTTYTTAFAVI